MNPILRESVAGRLVDARCCRVCKCTDERPCEDGCSWVGDEDLCSSCVPEIHGGDGYVTWPDGDLP